VPPADAHRMNGAGTSAEPAGKHPAWCAVDVLPPGGQWHCCSGHAVVELSPRRPDVVGDGAAPGKLSVFLAQGPYDIRPRLWLAFGDVDRDSRADAAELTVGEAQQLVKALTEAMALATPTRRGANPDTRTTG